MKISLASGWGPAHYAGSLTLKGSEFTQEEEAEVQGSCIPWLTKYAEDGDNRFSPEHPLSGLTYNFPTIQVPSQA